MKSEASEVKFVVLVMTNQNLLESQKNVVITKNLNLEEVQKTAVLEGSEMHQIII